jgi:hypothetical protein
MHGLPSQAKTAPAVDRTHLPVLIHGSGPPGHQGPMPRRAGWCPGCLPPPPAVAAQLVLNRSHWPLWRIFQADRRLRVIRAVRRQRAGWGDAPVPSAGRAVVRVREAAADVAVGPGLFPRFRRRAGERARHRPVRGMVSRHLRHQGHSRESASRTRTPRPRPAQERPAGPATRRAADDGQLVARVRGPCRSRRTRHRPPAPSRRQRRGTLATTARARTQPVIRAQPGSDDRLGAERSPSRHSQRHTTRRHGSTNC